MGNNTYPINTWYVAAEQHEVSGKTPLARKICGHDIVFYRDGENNVVALEDFCPHRGAALSKGFMEDGNLVCGYHGLKMGKEGKTLSMPKQRVERFPCIRAFPVVEKDGFVWLWPGDKAQADPSLIPNFFWADKSKWAYGGGLYHIECDYRLMIDNLMDLTHETYVHATSIGQKEIDETPVKTKLVGKQVVTERHMEGIYAPPFWQSALEANDLPSDQLVDRWQLCRFDLPSHITIEVGVALQGNGGYDAAESQKANSVVVDFITPETENSIHYFWGMARSFKIDDHALTDSIRTQQGAVFMEDKEVLEAQQRNLNLDPSRKLLMLDIDAGGVMARRLISKAIDAEKASQSAAQLTGNAQ